MNSLKRPDFWTYLSQVYMNFMFKTHHYLKKLISSLRHLRTWWFSMHWILLAILCHLHPSHAYWTSLFWPNSFGYKTPTLGSKPTMTYCGSPTSKPQTLGFGVSPKLQKINNLLHNLQGTMMQMAKSSIPNFTDIAALHFLCLSAYCNTIIHI